MLVLSLVRRKKDLPDVNLWGGFASLTTATPFPFRWAQGTGKAVEEADECSGFIRFEKPDQSNPQAGTAPRHFCLEEMPRASKPDTQGASVLRVRGPTDQTFLFEECEHRADGGRVRIATANEFLLRGLATLRQHSKQDILVSSHAELGEGGVSTAAQVGIRSTKMHGQLVPQKIGSGSRCHVYATL
jgi:hypothetical protein